ncbi:unnamed protein product, partial [Vitis vinifera]
MFFPFAPDPIQGESSVRTGAMGFATSYV